MNKLVRILITGWLLGGLSSAAAAQAPQAAPPAEVLGAEARRLLEAQRVGVLATNSVEMGGFPFASLTPYVLDAQGRPLVLISSLAQHTRNIQADPRVSLLVYNAEAADAPDAARLTWMGRAAPVPAEDRGAKARYLERFPDARRFFEARDFKLYRIEGTRAYYIGGFGRIFWLEPRDVQPLEKTGS